MRLIIRETIASPEAAKGYTAPGDYPVQRVLAQRRTRQTAHAAKEQQWKKQRHQGQRGSCLYARGAWGYGTWGWGLRPQRLNWLWLPLAGMLVAVGMERLALDYGRWRYGPHMPVLPGLEVGVLPVVQMGFLPLLVVLTSTRV